MRAALTQEKVAERLGKSRPAVAQPAAPARLWPASVQQLLRGAASSPLATRARWSGGEDRRRQVQLANLTVQQGWSVRQLERICAQPVNERPQKAPWRCGITQFSQLEGMARELFGTRARLEGSHDSGRLTLYYYSAGRSAAHLGCAGDGEGGLKRRACTCI